MMENFTFNMEEAGIHNNKVIQEGKGILENIVTINNETEEWISKLKDQTGYKYPEERITSYYERLSRQLKKEDSNEKSQDNTSIREQLELFNVIKEM